MVEKKKSKSTDAEVAPGPKKGPGRGKRYFLATMNETLIKDLKQAAIADDKSASECLEAATAEWLERRKSKKT